jgi:hydrogenase-4 component B
MMWHNHACHRREWLCHIIFMYSRGVNAIALLGLAVLAAALLALAAGGLGRPRVVAFGGLALCGAGVLLVLAALAADAPPALLVLPFGPPGAALALDGLSGFFLLLLLLSGMAICAAALDQPDAATPLLTAGLGAAMLALLAGDGFTLVFGFVLALLAGALLALADRQAAARGLGTAVLAAMALVLALGLLASGGWAFAAMRAHPPEAWRAAALLALLLVGLASLLFSLPSAQPAASGPGGALLSGLPSRLGVYVLIRVLFDLAGPAPSVWWGLPLLLVGAVGAVLGGLRATLAGDIKAILGWAAIGGTGMMTAGLGLALAARAVDLAPVASLALGAVLLAALAQALFMTLLALAAGAVQQGAGSRLLDRLGGLIHGMPVTTACVLAGGAGLAALPPSAGFAAWWMLFQALLAAMRVGGMALQVLICAAVVLLALATALQAMAAIRLIGVGFLGRPRSPRAAAAEEAGRASRIAMIALAVATGVVGIFPGGALVLTAPALRLLLGVDLSDRAGAWLLAARVDAAGYSGPAIAVLLALCLALVLAVLRRRAASGHRTAPAWEGGFDAPPPWLPLGDPLTQVGATGFSALPRRVLGGLSGTPGPGAAGMRQKLTWLAGRAGRHPAPSLRATLWVLLAALMLLLLLVAGWEQP